VEAGTKRRATKKLHVDLIPESLDFAKFSSFHKEKTCMRCRIEEEKNHAQQRDKEKLLNATKCAVVHIKSF
jgi:hypothetical protein